MKTLPFLPLIIIMLMPSISRAQIQNLTLGQHAYTLSSVHFRTGLELDYYEDISPDWMKNHIDNPEKIDFDANGFEIISYASVIGLAFGGQLSFINPRISIGKFRTSRQINFGIDFTVGREALVTFSKTEEQTDSTYNQNQIYCLMANEFRIGGEYRYVSSWGRYNAFVGGGVQLGAALNNKMIVFDDSYAIANDNDEMVDYEEENNYSSIIDTYKAKSSLYLRAFIPFGISMRVSNFEIGMEHKLGIGAEQVIGGNASFLYSAGLTYLTLGYHF
ncbi:MAG: hypothetical protein JKY52_04105 [Flavobacteriales bacterium]|nr:hypothetical protein [Flavobacteriales bacterium]